jgi:hypothetical protein
MDQRREKQHMQEARNTVSNGIRYGDVIGMSRGMPWKMKDKGKNGVTQINRT